jgi:hypothetical protein
MLVDRDGTERLPRLVRPGRRAPPCCWLHDFGENPGIANETLPRARDVERHAMAMAATIMAGPPAAMLMAVSFCARERFSRRDLTLDILVILDDLRETQESGADLKPRPSAPIRGSRQTASCRSRRKSSRRRQARQAIEVARCEDRQESQSLEQLVRPLRVHAGDVQHMVGAAPSILTRRVVGGWPSIVRPLTVSSERVGDRAVSQHAQDERHSGPIVQRAIRRTS